MNSVHNPYPLRSSKEKTCNLSKGNLAILITSMITLSNKSGHTTHGRKGRVAAITRQYTAQIDTNAYLEREQIWRLTVDSLRSPRNKPLSPRRPEWDERPSPCFLLLLSFGLESSEKRGEGGGGFWKLFPHWTYWGMLTKNSVGKPRSPASLDVHNFCSPQAAFLFYL